MLDGTKSTWSWWFKSSFHFPSPFLLWFPLRLTFHLPSWIEGDPAWINGTWQRKEHQWETATARFEPSTSRSNTWPIRPQENGVLLFWICLNRNDQSNSSHFYFGCDAVFQSLNYIMSQSFLSISLSLPTLSQHDSLKTHLLYQTIYMSNFFLSAAMHDKLNMTVGLILTLR